METLQNRYILKRQLGSGGMASVWLAWDPVLEREVAIKIIQKRFLDQADFLERFRREAAIAANLEHQGIGKVYEQGDDAGTPFIVMEYIKGPTLRHLLQERKEKGQTLTFQEAKEITEEILRALKYAHNYGVLHRDIKPQNIILSDTGVKLIDFGVAQIAGASQITTPGEIIGTAEYLAPEIAKGEAASEASDLYALAAVFYEMLTGQTPYPGKTIIEVITKQTTSDPILASKLHKDLDPYFDHLLFRGLSKDPGERFQNADQFLQALEKKRSSKKSRKALLPLALALTLCLLAFFTLQGSSKEMVSFIGIKEKRAKILSKQLGIKAVFIKEYHQSPPGKVFWQSEDPGEKIDTDATVLFYISKGQKKSVLRMPNFIGKNLEQASEFLQNKGISTRIVFRQGPEGKVIASDPAPGEELSSAVVLFIGKIALPSLVGKDVNTATQILRDLGISYSLEYEESSSAEGTVIRQDPETGILENSVLLTIATGSKYNTVPNLVGLSEQEALTLLRESMFSALVLYESSEESTGLVLRQDPPSSEARIGTTVRIWVSTP